MNNGYDYTIYNALSNVVKVCRLTTAGDETMTRCPFCLDSVKDPTHTHFYIQNRSPFKYYCQRCGAKGIFNVKLMNMFKMSDANLVAFLNYNQTQYKKQQSYKYSNNIEFISKKHYDYSITDITPVYEEKLLYIQGRLGIDIDAIGVNEFLNKYKVILSLSDFLEANNMTALKTQRFKFENQQKDLAFIDKQFVGFMSIDKNFITFRNVKGDQPRYKNMRLVIDEIENSKKLYMISNQLDLSYPEYNVYVTEGVFDLMGVYNHIYGKELQPNDVFVAANGKSHLLVMNSLLTMGITSANINIYSDKDVKMSFYKDLMKNSKLANLNGLNIYYNEIGKDYGVTKDEIKLSRPIIL